MKQLYFCIMLFVAFPLLCKAETATVTFDATNEADRTDEATLSKDGITITALTNKGNPGADFNADTQTYGLHYSFTSGATVFFNSTVGNITKVIITYSSGSTTPSIMGKSSGNFSTCNPDVTGSGCLSIS